MNRPEGKELYRLERGQPHESVSPFRLLAFEIIKGERDNPSSARTRFESNDPG